MDRPKTTSFGALCAALARSRMWTIAERGALLALLERCEPAREWECALGVSGLAETIGASRRFVGALLDRVSACGAVVVDRSGTGSSARVRVVPAAWLEMPNAEAPPAHSVRTPCAPDAHPPAHSVRTPCAPDAHPPRTACAPPAHQMRTSHVIGVGAGAPVAAPLSDPLSDPQSRVREGARTHARATPIPAHGSEPRAPASDLPSKPAQTVADLVAVVLACRPGVDARGRGRGVSISPVEERQLGELAAAHGVRAVEAVLLEHCGGAERPVTMAASRLSAARSGEPTRRPFQQQTESRPQAFRIVDTDSVPEPEPPRTDDEIARRRALWAAAVAGYPDLAELAIDTATA